MISLELVGGILIVIFFLPRYMLGKGSCSVASALIEMERKTDGISLMT